MMCEIEKLNARIKRLENKINKLLSENHKLKFELDVTKKSKRKKRN